MSTSGAFVATAASAGATSPGIKDQATNGAGTVAGVLAPTADKPESKLWYAGTHWWADMWDTTSSQHEIYELNGAGTAWTTTGVALDSRASTQSDTLWDGTHLYVASHVIADDSSVATAGHPANFYRYSLSGTTWSLDSGFPVAIEDYSVESMTIAKDSVGTMFATWTQGSQVYLAATTGAADGSQDPVTWGTPFVPPVTHTNVSADDISAVVAFHGNQVMVMWSNQIDQGFYYATHNDSDDVLHPHAWVVGVAASGTASADDHLNLATDPSDPAGHVYAAVKTSLNDGSSPVPTDTLLELLVFTPSTGTWASYPYSTVADSETRPIVQLDPTDNTLHMFATGPWHPGTTQVFQGTIFEKTTSMSNPHFGPGAGTAVITDGTVHTMNNVTGTKQTVGPTSGLVVLASDETAPMTAGFYYHADEALNVAPVADFTEDQTSGTAPLTVQFTDSSTSAPTGWTWDFGDSSPMSTQQNPQHTYAAAGTYSVTLTATKAAFSNTSPAQSIVVSAPISGGGGGGGGGGSAPALTRLAGADRFGTAVAISQASFPNGGAGAVVLARGDDYPDALVGASLASAKNAPVLLTDGAALPANTATEIQRVLAPGGTVYILGGVASVPASIATQLTALGYTVVRYAGADRFATAVQVANALGSPGTVLLASGINFPDALSAGAAAAKVGGVVLLTDGTTLPAETSAYLTAHATTVYAIGGPAALADSSATPLVGADRYDTSVDVAKKFFASPGVVGFASAAAFPDALAGAAYLAHQGAPLVLVAPTLLPAVVNSYLVSMAGAGTSAAIFGGDIAVSASVQSAIAAALL